MFTRSIKMLTYGTDCFLSISWFNPFRMEGRIRCRLWSCACVFACIYFIGRYSVYRYGYTSAEGTHSLGACRWGCLCKVNEILRAPKSNHKTQRQHVTLCTYYIIYNITYSRRRRHTKRHTCENVYGHVVLCPSYGCHGECTMEMMMMLMTMRCYRGLRCLLRVSCVLSFIFVGGHNNCVELNFLLKYICMYVICIRTKYDVMEMNIVQIR